MKTFFTMELRMFPILVRDDESGEVFEDAIVLSKQQLQAATLTGQSSRELIHRLSLKQGYTVIDIGKPCKQSANIDLLKLWR